MKNVSWRKILSWKVIPEVVHWFEFNPSQEYAMYVCDNLDELSKRKLQKIVYTKDPKKITCPTCQGLLKQEKQMDILIEKHQDEVARRRAEFTNLGAGVDDESITSYTTKGTLTSVIDPTTLRVTHEWDFG